MQELNILLFKEENETNSYLTAAMLSVGYFNKCLSKTSPAGSLLAVKLHSENSYIEWKI